MRLKARLSQFLESAQYATDTHPDQQPIRSELFSVERLQEHAASLAANQVVDAGRESGNMLARRSAENEKKLLKCYNTATGDTLQHRSITPAAEWLLDNYRVIEGQFKDVQLGLQSRSYRSLPRLAQGPLAGKPHVYGVIWAFIAHTDSRFDPGLLRRYLEAYQKVQPLSIAELWAIPVTLRCLMIENLRRVSVNVAERQEVRQRADRFADDLLRVDKLDPQKVDSILRELTSKPIASSFAVQLIQRLRYQDISLHWLNQELNRQGLSSETLVQMEHATQAADNMTVRNIITSLREMWAFDWQVFFEEVSVVEELLRRHPGYADMDFTTRDRYRHAIEVLAGRSPLSEMEVAHAALAKAAKSQAEFPDDPRRCDPGYYLITQGRREFEREIAYRASFGQLCLRAYTSYPATAYIGTILLLTALFLFVPLWYSHKAGAPIAGLFLLAVAGAFIASDLAVLLANKAIESMVPPRHLLRLELKHGIPPDMKTFVVVPTMLANKNTVSAQIEQLQVHYLANPEDHVHFALLTDWVDADTETREEDVPLLKTAIEQIAALNAQYGPASNGEPRFFLFHRKRLWNEAQQKWLAWERKRGKLHEFNRLLRGASNTSFITLDGRQPHAPAGIRFVITLDSDTRLPLGAVRQLVGTAAHPQNRPRLHPDTQQVIEGYGILQPRITPLLPNSRDTSVFQRIFSGPSGIDPYAGAVSNIYQDVFGAGSYTGKGIYDVDAFEASLAGRIPENTILSHDLFEGTFARCGLITDVELFEDFPSNYQVAASRTHRWMRGDWQLLPWILGLTKQPIPAIDRWKMLDNLRRSVSSPAMVLTLLAAWTVPNAPVAVWTAYVLLALAAPAILSILRGLLPAHRDVSLASHARAVGNDLLYGAGQTAVMLTLLGHQCWLALDAIGRTLFRLLVSHRLLLEWVTAAQAKRHAGVSLKSFTWSLRGSLILACVLFLIVAWVSPHNLYPAAPFLILWCLASIFARLISLPPEKVLLEETSAADTVALRLEARRIWRFFTTFVSAEDNFLPPDNFQEDPDPVVAHRTSPTNLGLYLLSIQAARDFGWIGSDDMAQRLEATLETMQKLQRYRGHFFNWYDTQTLDTLKPQYISTVDSGNLAGHLLALESGCREMASSPLFDAMDLAGIADSVQLLSDAIMSAKDDRRTSTVNLSQLNKGLDDFESCLLDTPANAREWAERWSELDNRATVLLDLAHTFAHERGDIGHSEVYAWAKAVHDDVASHLRDLPLLDQHDDEGMDDVNVEAPTDARRQLNNRFDALAQTAMALFQEMQFGFLYDRTRQLFSIGYRVQEDSLDNSYYDLLASEARVASFIAIAKGDIPSIHWFRLGRPLTAIDGGAVLMSWSGSMFEYLMPSLIMFTPRHSMLGHSCRLAVERQIEYGRERRLPWGISESAYNIRDRALTYQYSGFGVPGLGLKRGLTQNMVVAPYATLLAAMYDTPASAENLKHIEMAGGRGTFGFYDAIDYTLQRLPEGKRSAPVRVYMAHHQGMSLVALGNALFAGNMRHRFHRHPIIRAADLLLQEPQPREAGITRSGPDIIDVAQARKSAQPISRRFHSAKQAVPSTLLLSNGSYSLMVTTAGSGYSSWNGLAITRWREDFVADDQGSYLYLRDTGSGDVWSATLQPIGIEPDRYEVVFSEDRARISRKDDTLSSMVEIIVSPEDNAEIRRLSITNSGAQPREIEITSYAEIVLAPKAADSAHPAFSNLFIQTEYLPQIHGLVAKRRPRATQDPPVWAAHVVSGATQGETLEYETDRALFHGRGRSVHNPVAIFDGRPLSNTEGAVLDPIFSLRTRIQLPPGATKRVMFATMAAATREDVLALADKYHDPSSFDRISTQAWIQSQVGLHHLGIAAEEANLFQYLGSRILFTDPAMRPGSEILKHNTLNATSLWRFGISGNLPIILLRIDDQEDRDIIRQLLRAHEYWHSKGLAADLVILNERKSSYIQDLQNSIENMVQGSQIAAPSGSAAGNIFVLRADLMEPAEIDLVQCVARVTLSGAKQGSLEEQVIRMRRTEVRPAPVIPHALLPVPVDESTPPAPPLEFFNGLGGFTKQGREYVIVLGRDQRTPAPWVNVIANPDFGFLVSESGSGYTWASNSQSNQLSVWSNDPVSDPSSEVFYLRDEDSGALWTPTALPIRLEHTRYVTHHGHGYSRFEHHAYDISSTLLQFVSWSDPIKISTLTLTNTSSRSRKLTATAYIEWALGESRQANAPFIATEIDADTGAMFASNPWNPDFGECIAFAGWNGRTERWTGDRSEFVGRNGTLRHPAALRPRQTLSNRTGAGMDPCSALQTAIELAPGQQLQLTFLMGQAKNRPDAGQLIQRYRKADPDQVLAEAKAHWDEILNTLQVETPDLATDIVLNGWLLYQVLACRMWARAGFYQASGAYGFRDQLQDSMALNLARPDLTRAHLLRSAARQFLEGDVQHWWHPPTGRGVRTHITDDRLWLPYAVSEYVSVTGDMAVLDEEVPFLEGAAIAAGEESAYYAPTVSATTGSLYEHCARAIDCSLTRGRNGLPLMGGGDWNDGMNRVGHEGKGESVWLGWFTCNTIARFSDLARARADQKHVDTWTAYAGAMQKALEKKAWDGAWYRRAYFDDGSALGSASNRECRIDSIAQSWSVLSGVADPARQSRAMKSVEQYLVRQGDNQVLLFTPPFDNTTRDPGYIKGYLPGIRENGGQYTHAAVWCMMAYAALGDGNRAGEMFKMLNPVNHASSRAGVHVYKVEPYVVSADIYASPSHRRRGGWTWYTGSAGWLYRAGIEAMLGFRKRGGRLQIAPCIPQDWRNYRLTYRHGANTRYVITVENPHGVAAGVACVELDGKKLSDFAGIPLVDDGFTHRVHVIMGKTASVKL
ncbi:GH36-type glycosyl hydrolase domain-containing protein [Eoetvoesiella caeni]|uniref:Cyclic beta-1,2-glucan synthetase n=1 Tax=Eoetvoesiella caeni TaxID=645616 RepID=A0A366HIZ5_9BURK|nr:glucoamylase family protein [Eoetvoesiella caeni]MCI2807653.1 phosphorylase [Eoetvoesiella caeni]NYT52952.1 phosphorylase [Eoetvoesiella caeni]RBP42929.1 cyclic beta-1,2-glucan synthetase [Eoetvoesiella caeni]